MFEFCKLVVLILLYIIVHLIEHFSKTLRPFKYALFSFVVSYNDVFRISSDLSGIQVVMQLASCEFDDQY